MTDNSEPGSPKAPPRGASESLLQTLAARLHRLRSTLVDPETARLESIRADMLAALDRCNAQRPQLTDRVRFAPDLESLWYLRTDLLAALTQAVGDAAAAERLQGITAQFVGVLPVAATARTHRRK
jgi:hypothetical protein